MMRTLLPLVALFSTTPALAADGTDALYAQLARPVVVATATAPTRTVHPWVRAAVAKPAALVHQLKSVAGW